MSESTRWEFVRKMFQLGGRVPMEGTIHTSFRDLDGLQMEDLKVNTLKAKLDNPESSYVVDERVDGFLKRVQNHPIRDRGAAKEEKDALATLMADKSNASRIRVTHIMRLVLS